MVMVLWLMALIPLALNLCGAVETSPMLLLASVAAVPVTAVLLPTARGRENVFCFVLAALSLVPGNLRLVCWLLGSGFLRDLPLVSQLVWPVLLYWALFNLEQVILGIPVRLMRPRQYRNVFSA